ncbi:cupin domain-containing protein [Planctomycetota bacterium]
MEKVNIAAKLASFEEHWVPKVVGEVNDCYVKVVKFKGEYNWHFHEQEDELFMVVKGQFVVKLRDKDITLHEGELFIVPKGVEHMPVAEEEAQVMLFEKNTTVNTGNTRNERTILAEKLDTI